MKRVIVTGASGFVGANLARRLLRDGHEVYLLLRPGYQAWRLDAIRDHVRLIEAPLHDSDAVGPIVSRIRPDWVFHLAAHGAYSWQQDLPQITQTNILGTMSILTACVRVGFEAFVHAGTSSEYGYKDHPPAETEFLEPNSHYAVTKAAATLFCRYTGQHENLPVTTLRLYSVYGEYEDPGRLMPTLIRRGLSGELPPLVSPDTARDYVYIDDVVDAFLLAAGSRVQKSGAVYNLGTGVQTSLRQVVDVARKVLAIRAEPQWGEMTARPWDTNCWVADNRLIRQELGWAPQYSFEDGFRNMVEWANEHVALIAG